MARTGIGALIATVKKGCDLVTKWRVQIEGFIDSAPVGTTQQKTDAKAALDLIVTACHALEVFETIYR